MECIFYYNFASIKPTHHMNLGYTLCRHWNLLLRLPHRCGYGIHSPYAYGLVTGVVYERTPFYAYKELYTTRDGATLREKDDRLMLRLSNFQQPATAFISESVSGVTRRYLAAGCKQCRWIDATADQEALSIRADMLVACGEGCVDFAAQHINRHSEKALFVLHGIRSDKKVEQKWKDICLEPNVRLSFDLYDIGLLSFDPRFPKTNYIVFYS